MSEEKFYRCIPELNKECKKNNCYINGGECETTIYKKYTLKGLLEEIERLNNKLLKIKELIKRTPRQTPKEIAYIMLKGEIAEVIGDDKE